MFVRLVEKLKKGFLFPLLISWLIIFAHDVIPHDHHSHIHFNVHNHSDSILDVSTASSNLALNDWNSHECCDFSVDLLPRFSFDLEILPVGITFGNCLKSPSTLLFFSDNLLFIFNSGCLSQRPLRGPPANFS